MGARVPAARGVSWSAVSSDADSWVLTATRGGVPAGPGADALRAREVAQLLREADDALVSGDVASARDACVDAMERAPRQRDIARRVADIDARFEGRAEAALATLTEAAASDGGTAANQVARISEAELLVRTGAVDAAIACLERSGDAEPAPVLAARSFELAARLERDAEASARWLDRALARSPRVVTARWARVGARLALGRLEDALADVEFLEALTRKTRGKHAVWLRAGRAWQAAGLGGRAAPVFERALRYLPEDPASLMGLGVSLAREGNATRAVALLTRAHELALAAGEPPSGIALELSRVLAEGLDDLPAAVAHAMTIPSSVAEAPVARGLEGRWRAALGDVAGAALAFARLRDIAASLAPTADDARARELAGLVFEGARLELDVRRDPVAAQRHLATALRLSPHDATLRGVYREVGARLLGAGAPSPALASAPSAPPASSLSPASPTSPAMSSALEGLDDLEDPGLSAQVDELTRRLQADPTNDAVASDLARLLEDLGRGHELVALLGARLEDAPPERRSRLATEAHETLERLATRADASGQRELASLCRDAIDAFVPTASR